MSDVIINEQNLTDIADAIRSKLGVQTEYMPSEMASAIESIDGGTYGPKTITENGIYDASDDDLTGYSQVTVDVEGGESGTGFSGPAPIYDIGGFFGDNAGTSTNSLAISLSGHVNKFAILVIMHRIELITVPSDWVFVDKQSMTSRDGQYISIYKKKITSDSESYNITTDTADRICACVFYFEEDPKLEFDETILLDQTASKYHYNVPYRGYYRLCVISDYWAGSHGLPVLDSNIAMNNGTGDTVRLSAFVNPASVNVGVTINTDYGADAYETNRLYCYKIKSGISGVNNITLLESPEISINSNGYSYPLVIKDEVVSGFINSSNFFRPLDDNGNILDVDWSQPFEINVVFKLSAVSSRAMVLFGAEQGYFYAPSIEVNTNCTNVWCGFSTDGSTWGYSLRFDDVISGTLPVGEEINVNAKWDGTDYTVTLTYGSNTFVKSITPSAAHYYSSSYNIEFGGIARSSNHYAEKVSIDLSKSYIKSGNSIVWGAKNVSPNLLADWDFTESLTDKVNGYIASLWGSPVRDLNGVHIARNDQCIELPNHLFMPNTTYEIKLGVMDKQFNDSTHGKLFEIFPYNHSDQTYNVTNTGFTFHYQTQKWGVWDETNLWQDTNIYDANYFSDSTLKIVIDINGKWKIYKNNVLIFSPSNPLPTEAKYFSLGGMAKNSNIGHNPFYNMNIEGLKIYQNTEVTVESSEESEDRFIEPSTRRFDGTWISADDNGWVKYDPTDAHCLNYSWPVKVGHKYRVFSGNNSTINRGRNGFNERDVLADAEPNAQLVGYSEFVYNNNAMGFGREVTAPIDGYLICYVYYAGSSGTDQGKEFYLIDVTGHSMTGVIS